MQDLYNYVQLIQLVYLAYIQDIQVLSIQDFRNVIKRSDVRPGDAIELKILRDGKIKIVNLVTR